MVKKEIGSCFGDTRNNPGPGAYEITSHFSIDVVKYTCRPGDHSLDLYPDPSDSVIDRGLGGLQPTMHQRIETR
jgi:hypothetical protein